MNENTNMFVLAFGTLILDTGWTYVLDGNKCENKIDEDGDGTEDQDDMTTMMIKIIFMNLRL